jgi:site-specific DNA-cytosine methylase
MNLHPEAVTEPITIREAIAKDCWIDYRRGFGSGSVMWKRYGFGRPCLTIRKSHMGWKPTIDGQERQFSCEEAKRLQGFPEAFRFSGNYYEIWERLGNSVPPLKMLLIARHIRKEILESKAMSSLPKRAAIGIPKVFGAFNENCQ